MKYQIEKEFKTWVKQFGEDASVISAQQVEDDNQLVWYVDMYNETGKDFFKYNGNGNFEWMGEK